MYLRIIAGVVGFALWGTLSFPAYAEDNLAALGKRIDALELENTVLKADQLSSLKKELKHVKNKIEMATYNGKDLRANYDGASKNKNIAGLLIRMSENVNPTSKDFGMSFTDVVVKAAQESIGKDYSDEEDKKIFKNIVSNVVNNPIVTSILDSNPVSSAISSVIHAVSTFFNTKITGSILGKVVMTRKEVADQTKINAFKNKLAPYVDVYSEFIKLGNKYSVDAAKFDAKYKTLSDDVDWFESHLLSSLHIDPNGSDTVISQLNKVFAIEDVNKTIEYKKILEDESVIAASDIASKYPELKAKVAAFKKDYSDLLNTYFEEYKLTLNKAKALPEFGESTKIDEVIAMIEAYQHPREMQNGLIKVFDAFYVPPQ